MHGKTAVFWLSCQTVLLSFSHESFQNNFLKIHLNQKNRSELHLIMKQSQRASSKIKGTDWSEISPDEDTDSGCDIYERLKK